MSEYKGDETNGKVSPEDPGQGKDTETPSPGYVTSEQLEESLKTWGDVVAGKISEGFRGVQSQTDKFEARVNKLVERAEKAGIDVDDALRKTIRDTAIAEALTESPSDAPAMSPDQETPSAEDTPEAQTIENINATRTAMEALTGVSIKDGDPELDILDKASSGTPDEYIEAVREAIAAKAERTGEVDLTTVQARMPGNVSGKPVSNRIANLTGTELFEEVKKDLGW